MKILTPDHHDEIAATVHEALATHGQPITTRREDDDCFDLAYAITHQEIVGEDAKPIPPTHEAIVAELVRHLRRDTEIRQACGNIADERAKGLWQGPDMGGQFVFGDKFYLTLDDLLIGDEEK